MIKRAIGYISLFLGSFAILVSSVMLLTTILIPFIGESFSAYRGVTALAIMQASGMTVGYYTNTLASLVVFLTVGVATASLGRYVVDST